MAAAAIAARGADMPIRESNERELRHVESLSYESPLMACRNSLDLFPIFLRKLNDSLQSAYVQSEADVTPLSQIAHYHATFFARALSRESGRNNAVACWRPF